jgi:hypothetical protein
MLFFRVLIFRVCREIIVCQSVYPFVGIRPSIPPLPHAFECVPPYLRPKGGGTTLLADEGVGGPHSDDWKESLALFILCV